MKKRMMWAGILLSVTTLSSCHGFEKDGPLVRKLTFQEYDLAYYQNGSGKVFEKGTENCLLYLPDASFKEENLQECIYYAHDIPNIDLLDLLSEIGFPRYLGSNAYTLDFGRKDDNIVRFSFDRFRPFGFESLAYDEDGEIWLTEQGADRPSVNEAKKLRPDMSLDEVLYLLGKPDYFDNLGLFELSWKTIEGQFIDCNFSPRTGRKDKHVLRLNNWRPVPDKPIYRGTPIEKKSADTSSSSSTLLPPVWESEVVPPKKVRELLFQGYRFEYYENGSGKVIDIENETIAYETLDTSYKGWNLYDCIFLKAEEATVIDVIKQIGFPRFHGDDEDSLDFGKKDEGIVRIDFKNRIFQKMKSYPVDGNLYRAWVMPGRKDIVAVEDCWKVAKGWTLDEAIAVLGKAHEYVDDPVPTLRWKTGEERSYGLHIGWHLSDPSDNKLYITSGYVA